MVKFAHNSVFLVMVSKAGKTTEILDSNVMKKKHVRPVSFSERKFASVMDKISKSNIAAFVGIFVQIKERWVELLESDHGEN